MRPALLTLSLLLLLSPLAEAQQTSSLPPLPETRAVTEPNHILAANELIEIKVFQEPDLNITARISADGKILVPLAGEVSVAGRTVQQAAEILRERLEARYLVDPQVTLLIVEDTKRLFTVLGQVQRPGTYRFPGNQPLNLLQVIGIAGGYTRLADTRRITVKRQNDGRETVLVFDAKRMAREGRAEPVSVLAGDIITVGERFF